MEDCTDNKPQLMVKYQSFKEEENTSNISTDLVVVGNDSSIERKPNIRRQAAVRINEKNDIECLPGYRFNPFDHELLLHYLWRKLDDWVLCRIYKKDDRTRRAPKQSHADNSFDNSLDESSPSNQNAVAATRNDNYETGGDLCYDIGGNNPPLMAQNVVVQNPQLMGVNDLRSITDLRSALAMNNTTHFTNHYVDTSMHTPYLANPPAYSNPQPLRYIAQSSFPTYSLENLPYLDNSFENWGNTGQYYSPVENSFLNDSPTDPVLVQSNTGHVLQSISRNNLIVSENNSDIITPSNDNSPS
ncbi:hypothetical protein ACET3Z_001752 [Daucus carota]